MTALLNEFGAALERLVRERVVCDTLGLRDQLIDTRGELVDARLFGDAATDERDQARAELVGVTAQRDAHLSRSVELAARVAELEAKRDDLRAERDSARERMTQAREATRCESSVANALLAERDAAIAERDELRAELESSIRARHRASAWEQMLGRTHREGQQADEVSAEPDLEIARLRQSDLELRAALASEVRKTEVARNERDERTSARCSTHASCQAAHASCRVPGPTR